MVDTTQRQTSLPTGFGGSYDEYSGDTLDLNALLIRAPAATFYMRVGGDGMAEACIEHGDILVVDRSLTPRSDDIVVAVVASEFVVRRLLIKRGVFSLYQGGDEAPYSPGEGEMLEIWGVVTASITQHRRSI